MKTRDILMVSIIAAFIAMLVGKILTGCGLEPDKKVIVEREELPPLAETALCEGEPISTTRTLDCPDGQEGQVVEVCRADGNWYPASNTCKNICLSESPSWESSIKQIIQDHCISCHGGFNYDGVKNRATQTVDKKPAQPGNSSLEYYINATNPDVWMPKGMPPLPLSDRLLIQEWIENGTPESGDCGVAAATINVDYLESYAIQAASLDLKFERQNFQFVTFAHKAIQNRDLEGEYKALNQALNSISYENDIQLCKPVDPESALCVIDITALGLTKHQLALIQEKDKVKIVSNTTKGKILRELLKNDQPIMHYDVLIDILYTNQDLYYKLLGFKEFKQVLSIFGIDYDQQLVTNQYRLVGTNQSLISSGRNTRIVSIHEGKINGFDTACHVSYDNPKIEGAEFDFFLSPFIVDTALDKNGNLLEKFTDKVFKFTASEIICGLPNRLHAYALVDNNGVLQDAAPENIVFCSESDCIDATIENGIDCLNCHVNGFIPMVDGVYPNIKESLDFNAVELAQARLIYLDNYGPTFNLHNSWYRQAMTAIGRTDGEADYLTNAFNEYQDRQSLEQVAAFVFSTPDYIRRCISGSQRLRAQLAILLSGGKVTHDALIQALPELLDECELLEDAVIPQ